MAEMPVAVRGALERLRRMEHGYHAGPILQSDLALVAEHCARVAELGEEMADHVDCSGVLIRTRLLAAETIAKFKQRAEQAEARAAALGAALVNVAARTDADGQRCWCAWTVDHADYCLRVRTLLAKEKGHD